MRLIDLDKAIKTAQKQAKEIEDKKKKMLEYKPKDKWDKEIHNRKIEILNKELCEKAEILKFLVFDCEEVKINTKEKEQTP